jgi:hypothetical protein
MIGFGGAACTSVCLLWICRGLRVWLRLCAFACMCEVALQSTADVSCVHTGRQHYRGKQRTACMISMLHEADVSTQPVQKVQSWNLAHLGSPVPPDAGVPAKQCRADHKWHTSLTCLPCLACAAFYFTSIKTSQAPLSLACP